MQVIDIKTGNILSDSHDADKMILYVNAEYWKRLVIESTIWGKEWDRKLLYDRFDFKDNSVKKFNKLEIL